MEHRVWIPKSWKQAKEDTRVEDTVKASKLIKQRNISLGIQTMLGLPEDTFSKALKTAEQVVALKPDMVRIYPALVLKDTELESLYNQGRFVPLTVEEAVGWCAEIVQLYRKEEIKILRIGLHSSELLEGSIVAGPYHPAFGELVESRILLKEIIKELDNMELNENSEIIIERAPNYYQNNWAQAREYESHKRKIQFKNSEGYVRYQNKRI